MTHDAGIFSVDPMRYEPFLVSMHLRDSLYCRFTIALHFSVAFALLNASHPLYQHFVTCTFP
jgi:hypothetical protein